MTFAIGQKAVYPSRGIAEIVCIEKKEIHGRLQSFYVLRLSDRDLRIMVPIDKADASMRLFASDVLPALHALRAEPLTTR